MTGPPKLMTPDRIAEIRRWTITGEGCTTGDMEDAITYLLSIVDKQAAVVEAATEILSCEYILDPATISDAGVDANPKQVVGNIVCGYVRRKALAESLAALDDGK